MRRWSLLACAWIMLHGCGKSAPERAAQAAAETPVAQPAQCSPARRAPLKDREGLIDVLRILKGCAWSALTPRALANALGANLRASESGRSWALDTDAQLLAVSVDAPAEDAPATWIHFHPRLDLGVTMALMEALYGSSYRVLPPGKDTAVVFEPEDGSYAAIRLFGSFKTPKPAALVNHLQLRPPEVQAATQGKAAGP